MVTLSFETQPLFIPKINNMNQVMGAQLDLEEDIANVIKRHGLRHILRLKVNAADVVNVLKLLARGSRLIVVVLPPDGEDDLVFKIKSAFPDATILTYRSFRLDINDVLLAF